jgi:hypothetical protein
MREHVRIAVLNHQIEVSSARSTRAELADVQGISSRANGTSRESSNLHGIIIVQAAGGGASSHLGCDEIGNLMIDVPKHDPRVGVAIIRGHGANWDSGNSGSSFSAWLAILCVLWLWKSTNMDEIIVPSWGEVIGKVGSDCDDIGVEARAIPGPHQTDTVAVTLASPRARVASTDATSFTIDMRRAIRVQPHEMMVIRRFPQINAGSVTLALLHDVISALGRATGILSHAEDLHKS